MGTKKFKIITDHFEELKGLFAWTQTFTLISEYGARENEITIEFNEFVSSDDIGIVFNSILNMIEILFRKPSNEILNIYDNNFENVTKFYMDNENLSA